MGVSKNIKKAMIDKGFKSGDIAERTGLKPHNVYNSLNKDNMTVERAEMFAEAIGCELILRDKETGMEY